MTETSVLKVLRNNGEGLSQQGGKLIKGNFLRFVKGADPSRWLEPYHDWIRQAVRNHLPKRVQVMHHRKIASALTRKGARDSARLPSVPMLCAQKNKDDNVCQEAVREATGEDAIVMRGHAVE
ncbi:hypothetical protein [Pajaroellobacter abortibovis]|nr:hypothetical protein [Pajaroellobacter abortibovis]